MEKILKLLNQISGELLTNKELMSKPDLQQPVIKIVNGLIILVRNWGK